MLARAKLRGGEKYYGAYLGGFPERARALLGCTIYEPVLHVCGGKAKLYPYSRAFGPKDKTLDLNAGLKPDYCQDAREPYPQGFKAMLADPPYSRQEATNYAPGPEAYPTPAEILRNASNALLVGSRIGIIHYFPPAPPPELMCIAIIGVICGFNNKIRAYSVYEKIA
jgi:F0F1-type ATP synthase assembly protein I